MELEERAGGGKSNDGRINKENKYSGGSGESCVYPRFDFLPKTKKHVLSFPSGCRFWVQTAVGLVLTCRLIHACTVTPHTIDHTHIPLPGRTICLSQVYIYLYKHTHRQRRGARETRSEKTEARHAHTAVCNFLPSTPLPHRVTYLERAAGA